MHPTPRRDAGGDPPCGMGLFAQGSPAEAPSPAAMPELPELEVVREVLDRRIVDRTVDAATVVLPGGAIVVRDLTGEGFEASLPGRRIQGVRRSGKFLLIEFSPAVAGGGAAVLAVNSKLTGRLQLAGPRDRRRADTCLVLTLAGDVELRYFDARMMGQAYLVREMRQVPELSVEVPDALAVSRAEFAARLRPLRGEIKGVLTRGDCIAGIGNAYADEILWAACLHPYRKRTQLSVAEIDRLYDAMRETLVAAIDRVRAEMGDDVWRKPRDFLAVHMKSGEPCPRCGTAISLVGANQRITNFCRTCQPGGLVKGM